MKLASYLERIGYKGPVAATLDCLTQVHRRQAFTIPYENLDVQLGRPLDFDTQRIFEKMVVRRRGGWCYEIHQILLWALKEIGFDAMLVTAGIYRHEKGDTMLGNHTAILVNLDQQTYLADLGLGDGIRDPIPLREGTYQQGSLSFRLERVDDGYWRFHNHELGYPNKFDFQQEPADRQTLVDHSQHLQTSDESIFVQNLVCQIMQPASVTCLTGRVLRHKLPSGTTKSVISADEFEPTIATVFGIRDAELATLWPQVEARHELLFGSKSADEINFQGF
jgi:N-hydroxyarylamine O-acetyltransferase